MVSGEGIEPSRLPTRPLNVRVYQFRHPDLFMCSVAFILRLLRTYPPPLRLRTPHRRTCCVHPNFTCAPSPSSFGSSARTHHHSACVRLTGALAAFILTLPVLRRLHPSAPPHVPTTTPLPTPHRRTCCAYLSANAKLILASDNPQNDKWRQDCSQILYLHKLISPWLGIV